MFFNRYIIDVLKRQGLRLTLLTVAALLVGETASAADGIRYAPVIPQPEFSTARQMDVSAPAKTTEPKQNPDEPLLPNLGGIVFTNHPDRIDAVSPESKGVSIGKNASFAFSQWPEFVPTVEKYLNRPLTSRSLEQMEKEISAIYKRHGISAVQTIVPNQDAGNGTLQVLLVEGWIGNVQVNGARYFDSEMLSSHLWAKKDNFLDENDVREDALWLSRNPFIKAKPRVEKGDEVGEIDLYYDIEDRFPLMGTIGYTDTGTQGTRLERVIAGATYGNLFQIGGLMNYQLTASPDYQSLVNNSFLFAVPLAKRRNFLTVSGNYATINPNEYQNGTHYGVGFDLNRRLWTNIIKGDNDNDGGIYRVAKCSYGFDFMHTNTDLDYGGSMVFGQPVETALFNIGFNWTQIQKCSSVSFDAAFHLSPGGFSKYNDDTSFQAFSGRMTPANYYFFTMDFDLYRKFSEADFHLRMFGQTASEQLMSYDQMGVGGNHSVRGYDTYTEEADGGFLLNLELLTPSTSPKNLDKALRQLPAYQCVAREDEGDFQLFTFFDFGIGVDCLEKGDESGSDRETYPLAGTGVGMKYSFGQWVSMEAAYGFQLIKPSDPTCAKTGRPHIQVTISR